MMIHLGKPLSNKNKLKLVKKKLEEKNFIYIRRKKKFSSYKQSKVEKA